MEGMLQSPDPQSASLLRHEQNLDTKLGAHGIITIREFREYSMKIS